LRGLGVEGLRRWESVKVFDIQLCIFKWRGVNHILFQPKMTDLLKLLASFPKTKTELLLENADLTQL
jgi:hypothetical protein